MPTTPPHIKMIEVMTTQKSLSPDVSAVKAKEDSAGTMASKCVGILIHLLELR